ncbi:hypothetical protein MGALJ_13120 [Mycobacterium gallinarum]|uniref:Alanine and proline rich membrane protein n=1 Tax=Mycobacterium gallinarum TaxID=39689 RepID=A0A9W4FEC7_9MYCO|nr:hypothetical protein [Mycobacterium gallinarum]MDV3136178.1 hypothetical protein [Mycobacterium sp. 29Ha]BBY91643.1 hypothetical protein MGALJ_13120 [Mycobacterium gallinarum]
MPETAASAKSSIVSVLALVIALTAVGLAAWVLIKESKSQSAQSGESVSVFTGDAADDPKATICEAFNVVRTGVQTNTNLQPPGGPEDVTGSMAVAANARLSLVEGGQYLLARLQPDTSQDLTDAIRTFANQLMDIGAHSIAGIPNSDPAQSARLKEADASSAEIADLCK